MAMAQLGGSNAARPNRRGREAGTAWRPAMAAAHLRGSCATQPEKWGREATCMKTGGGGDTAQGRQRNSVGEEGDA